MNRLHPARRSLCSGARQAFTLVEVLLATFIIALGVIGLLALFAGAAKQQQAASQTTVSVINGKTAEAIVAANFGRLSAGTGGTLATLREGVWYPLAMHPTRYYLTLNPTSTSDGIYFEVPAPIAPLTVYEYTGDWTQAQGIAGFPAGALPAPFTSRLQNLGQRRIVDRSLTFTVETVQVVSPTQTDQDIQFLYARNTVPNLDPLSDAAAGIFAYYPNGDGNAVGDVILVDVQQTASGTAQASIVSMNINDVTVGTNRAISRITADNYRWQNDALVSLNDRLVQRVDPQTGEPRPDQAYSMMFRTRGGTTQVAIFTYQLSGAPPSAQFIPPERQADLDADPARSPLRTVDLLLKYEASEQAFYVEAAGPDADEAWVFQAGQILMMRGDPDYASAQPPEPHEIGADQAVRVLRIEPPNPAINRTKTRAYLDRGPRAGNQAMLPPEDRGANDSRAVTAYGINDVVESLPNDDGTRPRWSLRALDVRVFQVAVQ